MSTSNVIALQRDKLKKITLLFDLPRYTQHFPKMYLSKMGCAINLKKQCSFHTLSTESSYIFYSGKVTIVLGGKERHFLVYI